MKSLRAAYVFDEKAREEANRKDLNYWWAYIAEILDRLGLTAVRLTPAELSKELSELSLLFLGNVEGESLAPQLDTWVKAGGILIGCNSEGLDGIFGNRLIKRISQEKGDFSLNGKLSLRESPFTEGIHCPVHPENPLLVASPIRLVSPINSVELGHKDRYSLITARQYDKGWAFYFGFDLAQTFWVIQQGRPVDRDYDGDGYLRASDGIIIEDNEPEIPYTDELLFLLQNMVGVLPFPLLHQLPPCRDGSVPDALFYYGGDDEATPGIDVPASEFMKNKGLPYHINIMPDGNSEFAVSPEEVREIEENGTEISLHYDFVYHFDHPCGYTEKDVEQQVHLFTRRFGKVPVCANMHCVRWTGWHEPALWAERCGLKAVNGKVHRKSPPSNPVNEIGFSFGTSFPFFYWTDYTYGNKRIDLLDLPIVAYECGYKENQTDFPKLEKVINLASHYNMIMNVFYHPVYVATYPACRSAIDRLLQMIQEKDLNILHSTPDKVTEWWFSRSQSKIEDIQLKGNSLNFTASCSYPEGFIAKIPLGSWAPLKVDFPHKIIEKFGQRWLFLVLPTGEKKVTVEFCPAKT